MKALKFTVSGRTAFFKIPEVNSVCYFTYGNLHKPALLGMLGAIMGYSGYSKQKEDGGMYPAYYEKLQHLRVSILPAAKDGYFPKKVQVYNNSVGYASAEEGGNMIVKEQWLENPAWTVYVLLDSKEAEAVEAQFMAHRCIYMPYLGKNDHPATISGVETVDLEAVELEGMDLDEEEIELRCLTPDKVADFDLDAFSFKYGEFLPVALRQETNQYVSEKFILTDGILMDCKTPLYRDGKTYIVFY